MSTKVRYRSFLVGLFIRVSLDFGAKLSEETPNLTGEHIQGYSDFFGGQAHLEEIENVLGVVGAGVYGHQRHEIILSRHLSYESDSDVEF